jgi:hypothetical protein
VHTRACLDAKRVEQLGELAVEIATEFGGDRIGEACVHRARLIDGQPGPVGGVDVDQGAQRRVEHHRRVVEVSLLRDGVMAHQVRGARPQFGCAGTPSGRWRSAREQIARTG